MSREITITVDEIAYQVLKPMVEQQTIGALLRDFIQNKSKQLSIPDITALRDVDTSNIRDETDRIQ